jgi:ribosomal protein S18 acetylase RimI-like enzyme
MFTRMYLQQAVPEEMWLNDLCPEVEPYLADVLGEKVHFMAKDAETLAFPEGQDLIVSCSAVHWLHRQKGLGRWLMRLSQHLAQQWKLRSIYLSVDCENMPARTLYEQLGLQISGQLADYYGQDRHGLRMRLKLLSAK